MARSYRDLDVWNAAMELSEMIYHTTDSFPADERYGLVPQMCRASVLVPSNIAEGSARRSPKEFTHFLSIAYGSLCELETQILLAVRLCYISPQKCDEVLDHIGSVGRMLKGLMRSLKTKKPSNREA